MPPLSLYIHLPWCVRKCPYCDFNSHTAGDAPPRARYLEALARDLALEAARAGDRPLVSIFIGGGTPTLFNGSEIGALLDVVRREFTCAPDIEITLEANPGTVERDYLGGYRAAGVNRLSLGAQSFQAESLERLGRIHSPADITNAVRDARAAGFGNINLDLMFALPGQTAAMQLDDLEQALALAPEHLSLYQLTLEPNTVFFRRPPAELPDDDAAWDMQLATFERLGGSGYERYEISAFARPGRECRHNLNYWHFGDYLAAGAGAHGKVTMDGDTWRYAKPAHPLTYMERAERGDLANEPMAPVGRADRVFEYMLNALRLPGGFRESDFAARTGLPFAIVRSRVEELAGRGLLEAPAPGRWRPSELGLRFLNDLQAHFLPSESAAA